MTKEEWLELLENCVNASNQGYEPPTPMYISLKEYKHALKESRKRNMELTADFVWKLRFEQCENKE